MDTSKGAGLRGKGRIMNKPPIAVVDFFSGCGGTSVGLRNSGMKIVAGIDNDADSAATFRLNFPEADFFESDVKELSSSSIEKVMPKKGLVLFAGCAPCQPFSKQKKISAKEDPRRDLLLVFLKFIVELQPHFVLVENVPGLQKLDPKSGPFQTFVDTLIEEGYEVDFGVVRAADYGVPQIRRRLVLVASRISKVRLPDPTHGSGLIAYSTVAEWIKELPNISAGQVDLADPDHASMKLSERNIERIQATPEGGSRLNWPQSLQLECHASYKGHTDVYGRLSWDKPASGLTTKCISYSNGRFGHPDQDRALSVREAALLQTFPPSFKLVGTLTSKARQVGNAVPPLVARRVGEAIADSLRV